MTLSVYAMKDKHTGFLTPTFELNDQVAVRSFTHALLNSPGSILGFAPGDFDLYSLGEFDTDTGLFSAHGLPTLVITGDAAFHSGFRKEDS